MERRKISDTSVVRNIYAQLRKSFPEAANFIGTPSSPYDMHHQIQDETKPYEPVPELRLNTMTPAVLHSKLFRSNATDGNILFHFVATHSSRAVLLGCTVYSRSTNSTHSSQMNNVAVLALSPYDMFLVSPVSADPTFFGNSSHDSIPLSTHEDRRDSIRIGTVVFGYWRCQKSNDTVDRNKTAKTVQFPPFASDGTVPFGDRGNVVQIHHSTDAFKSSLSDIDAEDTERIASNSAKESPLQHQVLQSSNSRLSEQPSKDQVSSSPRGTFEAWDWVNHKSMSSQTFRERYTALDSWIRSLARPRIRRERRNHFFNNTLQVKLKTSLPVSIFRPCMRQLNAQGRFKTNDPFAMCAFFAQKGCLGIQLRWTNVAIIRLKCSIQRPTQDVLRSTQDSDSWNMILHTAEKYNIGSLLSTYEIGVAGMQAYRLYPKYTHRTCSFELRILKSKCQIPHRVVAGSSSTAPRSHINPRILLTFVPNSITTQDAITSKALTGIVKRMQCQIEINDLYNSFSDTERAYENLQPKCNGNKNKNRKRHFTTDCGDPHQPMAKQLRVGADHTLNQGGDPFSLPRRSRRIQALSHSRTIRGRHKR